MRRNGMFGPIEIRDCNVSGLGVARCVLLNGQVQGGALLDPPAAYVSDDLPSDAPGPYAESTYALGWLLAGQAAPTGSGVMIGLGSGSGATQLLHCFPDVDLTVVEIDPVMAQVALDTYPLLQYSMDQGRLNIVVDDAREYLRRRYDHWDFGLADAYTGARGLIVDYLPLLCDRADIVCLNVIDRFPGPVLEQVFETMWKQRKAAQWMFRALPIPSLYNPPSAKLSSNWIVTSDDVNVPAAAAQPPEGVEDIWAAFLSTAHQLPLSRSFLQVRQNPSIFVA